MKWNRLANSTQAIAQSGLPLFGLQLFISLPNMRFNTLMYECVFCVQFARDQRVTLGLKPWPERYKAWKADKLASAFPQYDRAIVQDYAVAFAFDYSSYPCSGALKPSSVKD